MTDAPNHGFTARAWRFLAAKPLGPWLFTRLVCWKAPYFASIRPRIHELAPGRCVVTLRKRRAVLNHLGGVHAIAMCNMAELAGGMMTEVSIPDSHRWIPKGMTVAYLRRAGTGLRAVAAIDPLPDFGDAQELVVPVEVTDQDSETVFRADITMWVSRRKPRA